MRMRTDLDGLRELIAIPEGVGASCWVLDAVGGGDSFVPGPTDVHLLALLRPGGAEGWEALEAVLGPASDDTAVVMPAEAARALLGESPVETGEVTVRGRGYDARALSTARFRAGTAVRTGDGVIVSAVSS